MPATTPPMSRKQLECDIASMLVASMSEDHPDNDEFGRKDAAHRCMLSLPSYSDEALIIFKEAAAGRLGEELLHLLAYKHWKERYLIDWIMIEPYSGVAEKVDVRYVVNALPHYDHLAEHASNTYAEQIRAILRVTNHLVAKADGYDKRSDINGDPYVIIKDVELRTLLTTHENPRAVADIIASRDLTDPHQIVAVLELIENVATSVSEGAL